MKRIYAGKSGGRQRKPKYTWCELELTPQWKEIIDILVPSQSPREVQLIALSKEQVLNHQRNLIVSSPTNSGKSLVGLLILFQAIRDGNRAALIVPLRAIAREKAEELERVASKISKILGRPFTVRISTGDYRIESEVFSDPPPDQGELIIATPERFEAILRNPAHDKWISTIAAVCVDEAHLINSPRRGPTLEYLLTSLLCLPTLPRLVLLSATMGETGCVREWLKPCDVISVIEREPPLRKEVWALDENEDASEIVIDQAREILSKPKNSLLIFVYQTKSAERLAVRLNEVLGQMAGGEGAFGYHSQMSANQRNKVRAAFSEGSSRCVVATTALGLGVNLPATHVIVRDSTFAGRGKLGLSELLQMMGRAGRGTRQGAASVIVRINDGWKAAALATELREEVLPAFVSHYDKQTVNSKWESDSSLNTITTHLAAQLARHPENGFSVEELKTFFSRSLGGKTIVAQIPQALSWLTDTSRVVAFRDENGRYRLTTLGLAATRAVLPLKFAAGFAQLFRDFLSIDPSDRFLEGWKPLDHLIILDLLSEHSLALRPFSHHLTELIDAWMEKNSNKTPLLFREWIAGQEGKSRAIEVCGSLGVTPESTNVSSEETARRSAYMAVFRSIVLYERGKGTTVEEIERKWGLKGMEGIEERWRDEYLWLLSGLAKILDVRCFYFHLREECVANPERVQKVKRALRIIQSQTFELQEHLKYCSPLGPVLRSLRRTRYQATSSTIGLQSIRRLEEAGIKNINDLAKLSLDDLLKIGIRRELARQIRDYSKRRLQ